MNLRWIIRSLAALAVLSGFGCNGGSSSTDSPSSVAWAVAIERETGGALILKSVDGGASWDISLRDPDPSGPLDAVDFVDADVGWAVGNNDVFHTNDGGVTWSNQADNLDFGPLILYAVDFVDRRRGVIVGTEFPDPPTSFNGPPASFFTIDGGATWERSLIVPIGIPIERRRIRLFRVCLDPSGVGISSGLGFGARLVLTTADFGRTWEEIETAFPGSGVACADGSIWAAGADDDDPSAPPRPRLFQSFDGGRTWEDRSSGIDPAVVGGLGSIALSGDGTACASGAYLGPGGTPISLILRSSDGGSTWDSTVLPETTGSLSLRSVSCPSSTQGVAGSETTDFFATPPFHSLLFALDGSRWAIADVPDSVGDVRAVSFPPISSSRLEGGRQ